MPGSDRDGPPPEPRPRPAAAPPSRPEAFGRGEHAEPNKPDDKSGKGDDEKKADDSSDEQNKGEDKKGGDKGDGKGKGDDEQKKPKTPFYKRPVLMAGLILIVLAGIGGGIYAGYYFAHYASTDDAFIDGRIVRVSPRVAGKIVRLAVTDNEPVSADQVLVEIDRQPFEVRRQQAVAAQKQAEAQVEQARANLLVAQAQADQADADVTVSQANARNAQQNFERFNRVSQQARSQQQVDQATADQKSSAATVIAQQKRADSMHAMAKAAQTAVDAAEANVNAARSSVDQAMLDLSYCRVVAGYKGRVTMRRVDVGNYVTVGQEILTVVPTDVRPDESSDIWVTANYKESQLTHMKVGQRVTIKVDAFPDEDLRGHVASIQNGTGAVFSLLPPENATGNYVKVVQRIPVKIVLDGQPRHLLSPGLSVVPTVDISSDVSPDKAETDPTNAPPAVERPATVLP